MPSSTAQSILPLLICQNDTALGEISVRYSFTLAQDITACRMRKFTWPPVKSKASLPRTRRDHPTSQSMNCMNCIFKDEQLNTDTFLVLLGLQ